MINSKVRERIILRARNRCCVVPSTSLIKRGKLTSSLHNATYLAIMTDITTNMTKSPIKSPPKMRLSFPYSSPSKKKLPTGNNGVVSSKKVKSLRQMVRSARKSMERRTDKTTGSKEEPSESSTHESTQGESLHDDSPLFRSKNVFLGKTLPFMPRDVAPYRVDNDRNDDSEEDHDDEVSLGSVGAALPLGKARPIPAGMDSSWGTLQTSGDSSTFPTLTSSMSQVGASFCHHASASSLGKNLQQLSRQDSSDSLASDSLASWGNLSVGNDNIDLQQSSSGVMLVHRSLERSARFNSELYKH